jgi:hypothetical protein
MEPRSSWEATNSLDIQEFIHILCNIEFTILTGARNWSMFWVTWIESIYYSCFSKINFNIIHPSTSRFPNSVYSYGFSTERLHESSFAYILATCPVYPFLADCRFGDSSSIQRRVQAIQHSTTSHYFISRHFKCSPQHLLVRHHRSVSVPYCQRPSLTPIQNCRQTKLQFRLQGFWFLFSYAANEKNKFSGLNDNKHYPK